MKLRGRVLRRRKEERWQVAHTDSQFRQVVHDFAQKEIAPRAAEIDKTNKMPAVSYAPTTDCEGASGRSARAVGSDPFVEPTLEGGLRQPFINRTLAEHALTTGRLPETWRDGSSGCDCSLEMGRTRLGLLEPYDRDGR